MRKIRQLFVLLGICIGVFPHTVKASSSSEGAQAYDYTFESLNGDPLPLSAYKGKVILVVNTASNCGFTKQYAGLQKLYEKYAEKGLIIIGIPSNDFGAQEPGNESEIKAFCELNYGVKFPMTSKQIVSGEHAIPFYKWVEKSLGKDATPKWNFHKILIDKNGHLVASFASMISPESRSLVQNIEDLL